MRASLLKLCPLIARVGVEFQKERIQPEQCRHQHDAAITILDIGCVDRCLHQQALRIDEDMPLLALDPLAGVKTGWIGTPPPFSAFLTLWLSMIAAVGLASWSACARQRDVEWTVQTIECAVMLSVAEIVIYRAARRKVSRDRASLATRSMNIHQAVHDLPYIHRPLGAATPGSRAQGSDQ